jgi:hypothetical protein
MIVSADPTNPARDEMCVPGIFVFHKNAITPEDGRSAMTLDDFLVGKVNFRKDAQTSNNPGDGIPGHLYNILWVGWLFRYGKRCGRHLDLLLLDRVCGRPNSVCQAFA